MLKNLFVIATILTSSVCNAQGWSDALTVEQVFTEGRTDLIVATISGGKVYTDGCNVTSWIFKADTDARRGRAYSTLMTALVSGKKIKFWFTDQCSSWNYHEAAAVMLVK